MADVMTTEEVSKYLRLSIQTVKQRARDGRMPAARIGRSWRFLKREIDEWLTDGADLYEKEIDEGLGKAAMQALQDPANRGKKASLSEVKAELGL